MNLIHRNYKTVCDCQLTVKVHNMQSRLFMTYATCLHNNIIHLAEYNIMNISTHIIMDVETFYYCTVTWLLIKYCFIKLLLLLHNLLVYILYHN